MIYCFMDYNYLLIPVNLQKTTLDYHDLIKLLQQKPRHTRFYCPELLSLSSGDKNLVITLSYWLIFSFCTFKTFWESTYSYFLFLNIKKFEDFLSKKLNFYLFLNAFLIRTCIIAGSDINMRIFRVTKIRYYISWMQEICVSKSSCSITMR